MKGDKIDQVFDQETLCEYSEPLPVTVLRLFGDWYWMPAHKDWQYGSIADTATFSGVDEYGGEMLYSMEYKLKTRWGAIMRERGRLALPLDTSDGL